MSRHDFSPEEFAGRRRRVFDALGEAGLDAFLAFHPTTIHWLTGAEAKSYQAFQCLIVDRLSQRLHMFTREAERAEFAADALIDDLSCWGSANAGDPVAAFLALMSRLALDDGRPVGMEIPAYYLHPEHHLVIVSALPDAREAAGIVRDLRLVKSEREIAYLREAARIADLSIDALVGELAIGRRENEIAAEIYRVIIAEGGDAPTVPLNLVSGPRAAFSHGAPTHRRLERGDVGNAEYCVPFKRHTVSIGRQFVLGEPSSRLLECFAAVREAAAAMRAAIRDGAPACAPHDAAVAVLEKAGLAAHRVHTTGYAVATSFPPATGDGLQMSAGSRQILKAGMLLSLCPNVFIEEERLGVRVVDNVLVTPDGAQALSRRPNDLIVAA
ncbi:MAG: aminopeptidase P family protein [Salinarimonadaceae bacterium]|nr:MAG: aminopeptidase P family protein [Salinarimonadaceae bacterium]